MRQSNNLQFLSVSLENYKAFRGEHSLSLDRNPGVYFVAGSNLAEPEISPNGAGKSTFLCDAPYWCLTGRTIRSARPGAATESWGAKATSWVQVNFQRNGINYSVRRGRRPNGLWLAAGDDDDFAIVEQGEVDRALGLSPETLRRTIIVGQFGDLFLDLKAEQQAAMFTEVLGLDIWLRASEQARRRAENNDQAIATHERNLAVTHAQIEAAAAALNTDKAALAEWAGNKAGRLNEAKTRLADAELSLRQERTKPKVEAAMADVRLLAAKRAALQTVRVACRESDHKTRRAEANACAERVKALTAEVLRYRDAGKSSVCPECGQKVTKGHFVIKMREAIDARDEEEQTKLPVLNGKAAAAEQVYKSNLAREETLQVEVAAIEGRIQKAAAGSREIERRIGQLEAQVSTAQASIAHIAAETNPFRQRVSDVEASQRRLQDAAAGLDMSLASARALSETNKMWAAEFKAIRLAQIDEALEELEVASNRHATALGLIDWEIHFATERETKSGSVSLGFVVTLQPPGQDGPVPWESYCGGEVQRWKLATTFGMSEVLLSRAGLSPNIEVLDEPTQHMSAGGVDALLEQLAERAQELGRAIYFIDHHSLDRGYFTDVLLVRKDIDGARMVQG